MLRSLGAVIIATLLGLSFARFIEAASGGGVAPGAATTAANLIGLTAGWLFGSFAAAGIALLIGRRWAPLAWIAAATLALNAIITLASFKLPFFLWPASFAFPMLGGFLAIKLMGGVYVQETKPEGDGLFDQ